MNGILDATRLKFTKSTYLPYLRCECGARCGAGHWYECGPGVAPVAGASVAPGTEPVAGVIDASVNSSERAIRSPCARTPQDGRQPHARHSIIQREQYPTSKCATSIPH